ncbi:MAG: TRAM domain-containing protein [Fibromonadaceae bacterium]|jgi:23S rRNA (uracil1939-C5)-methyltransferase|nr:TRAM domain-containing protein [Fibromonadaceae bacterium]
MGYYSSGEKVLKIEKIINGGAGFARLPSGSVCFVEGALPNEFTEIKITEQKKDFSKAIATKILEPNKWRHTPLCKYYGKCGGCNAQHVKFEGQIELLKQIVLDLFARTAKINLPQNFEIHHGAEWAYRYRAQVFATKNKNIPWGFSERAANNVVPIEKCFVLSQNLNEKLKESSSLKKRYLFDNKSEEFLGKHIHADESVFFQSNLELLPKLIDEIQKTAGKGDILLDIFSGVGLFSAFLQDKFERVIAVEQNPLCQKFAEKNLGKNCEFHAINAEDWFNKNTPLLSKSCILIDPPREGMTDELCQCLCKNKTYKLIYISCNPATLARDTRKLLNGGYKLESIKGFAFYPQTFHLEMMGVFVSH